jgi:hypothetical protein
MSCGEGPGVPGAAPCDASFACVESVMTWPDLQSAMHDLACDSMRCVYLG